MISEPGLYNMDCMVALKEYPDNYFDLAIVDPPYGIGCMSMNYTKSGAVRVRGASKATRRDYRRFSDWDERPTKEYFSELVRVSSRQIIWGGITSLTICRRLKALLYGIKGAMNECQMIMLIANLLICQTEWALQGCSGSYGMVCFKAT